MCQYYQRVAQRGRVKKFKVFRFCLLSNLEYLSNQDYFQDLLGIINLAGPIRNRRIAAQDVITDLVTTYSQIARALVEENRNLYLKELQFLEFIDCMKGDPMKARLVEYLVQQSANKNIISKAGPAPTPNVRILGGTIPRVTIFRRPTLT